MILRRIAAVLFVPLMLASGSGVYLYLGTLKSKVVKERPKLPTVTTPKFGLPGTMFVVQDGRLFKLHDGSFAEIGPAGNWSQPTLTPDHTRLIAVLRGSLSSDLYLLDLDGHVLKRLTKDDSRTINFNHWAFYPRVSPDGATLFYGFDNPKLTPGVAPGVDLSIWSMPLDGTQNQARRRTDPYWYSGGDVSPVPLAGTGLLFVRHSIDASTAVHSQIFFQSRPGALDRPLTSLADDCSQPALSPDGTQLAMDGGLFASPAWSPDSKALAYYAPSGAAGHFQLWWVALPVAATPSPTPTATHSPSGSGAASSIVVPKPLPANPVPVQVTQGVDLTATSAPAWY